MKPRNQADLDDNLGKLSNAIDYIEDPKVKAAILQIAHVYNRRVLRELEQAIFSKRIKTVEESDALIESLKERLETAYVTGVGVSAAEEALRKAWAIKDAATEALVAKIALDTSELYVDTNEFDNQDL